MGGSVPRGRRRFRSGVVKAKAVPSFMGVLAEVLLLLILRRQGPPGALLAFWFPGAVGFPTIAGLAEVRWTLVELVVRVGRDPTGSLAGVPRWLP